MDEKIDNQICDICGVDAKEDAEFCANCGTLFVETLLCSTHPGVPAVGACVLCGEPGCAECCKQYARIWLCEVHAGYEIVEGHVVVDVARDSLRAQFIEGLLKEQGLHPLIYTSTFNPGYNQVSQWMYTVFERKALYYKVLVPYDELAEALEMLSALASHPE